MTRFLLQAHRLAVVVLLLAAATATGCGRSTAAVSGIVVYKGDGTPFPGGIITFHPLDGDGKDATDRPGAQGEIQSDGFFRLGTYAPNDGVLPGKYRVLVQPTAVSEKEAKKRPLLIDVIYGSAKDSPVVVDVTTGTTNNFTIEVTKPKTKKS